VRCVVNLVAALCFAQLRYKTDEIPSNNSDTNTSTMTNTDESQTVVMDNDSALELTSLRGSPSNDMSEEKDELLVTPKSTSVIGVPVRRTAMAALPVPVGANTANAITARLANNHDDNDSKHNDERATLLTASPSSTQSSSTPTPSQQHSQSISTVFDINQVATQLVDAR
jgi:hypothetical protein